MFVVYVVCSIDHTCAHIYWYKECLIQINKQLHKRYLSKKWPSLCFLFLNGWNRLRIFVSKGSYMTWMEFCKIEEISLWWSIDRLENSRSSQTLTITYVPARISHPITLMSQVHPRGLWTVSAWNLYSWNCKDSLYT